jgi:hypothetical protein
MGFTIKDIQQTLLNAAQAAFLPAEDRKALMLRLVRHFT